MEGVTAVSVITKTVKAHRYEYKKNHTRTINILEDAHSLIISLLRQLPPTNTYKNIDMWCRETFQNML